MSQAELCRRVGISAPAYWCIEHGKTNPKPENAKKIAKVLGFNWTRFYDKE
jgi:putative transcriptional regulator